MAETRREARRIREQIERATGETAEEAARLGREELEAGERTAQTGIDLLQTGFEMFQRNVEFTLGLLKDVSERNIRESADLFGKASDKAQRVASQSERTSDAMSPLTETLGNVSSEWIRLIRHQTKRNVEHWNMLIGCRTPQDFVNAQNSVLRDNMEDTLQAWQMFADRSLRLGGKPPRS